MEIFVYATIFIIGTFFGSFFTLAVYRIPRKEDILIKHSYCPNCNHKLGFFDLFPVLSYLFLKGKCRYCGEKIRIRYLMLEILSGLSFIILTLGIEGNILFINNSINLAALLLYISVLFIISGIDKENIKIEKSVLIFGFIIEILYIIYQYSLFGYSVYQYVMYFGLFLLALIILGISNETNKYSVQILCLCLYILIFSGLEIFIFTTILSLSIIFCKIKNKNVQMPYGFYISICNIVIIAIFNLIIKYAI